ncbi:Uncharacterised protein [Mycobacterium tuberculosis]|nr:Uncharacterised protein [Mycobacterium tuberculosis]
MSSSGSVDRLRAGPSASRRPGMSTCGNHFSQFQSRPSRSRAASATPSTVGSCQVTA